MKSKSLLLLALLSLAMMITGARAGSAQQVQPLEPEWLLRMYAEGWQKVQEGVLKRDTGGGQLETFSYGAEGLQWVLEGYEQQLSYFEEKYSESPTPELMDLIEQLHGRINGLYGDLAAAPSAESFDGEVLESCSMSYDPPYAWAGPQESPRGVSATATANFESIGCGFEATTFATAYAHAIDGDLETTKVQNEPKSSLAVDGYPPIRSLASASANGSTACESWAQSELRVPQLGIILQSPLVQNFSCPPQVTVSIAGPAVSTTDYYTSTCKDVTWTATTTGGVPAYTYEWYIGTSYEGSGSTLTKNYCATNALLAVKVVARDSNGGTAEGTLQTELRHIGSLSVSASGPSQVNTTSSTPCANVTWTATSATGGHPGYTYNWYLDAGTTSQGTGSSFTKQYCSMTQTVTARVVVTDSDGHTSQATKQTSIIYTPPPPVAAISGPATVTTDYYTNSCANVTWTASATSGSPGYTYQWYLGTSTTLQGTGTTFTKNYCSTNGPVTVKVIAKDTKGATDDATLTTTLQYKGAIAPTITGPATVSGTDCTNVTWTASATSSGHSGFTYSWYIGTTLQGSGSTLTKNYCSSQSVTVKLVAKASDTHTSEVTKTTSISIESGTCYDTSGRFPIPIPCE